MKLPQLKHPTFSFIIPSTKQEIRFRPFLVKEEKILLFAQESKETSDIIAAIKQLITNCVITENVNFDELTVYDIEYFFLQLRAKSVNDNISLSYIDKEDNKQYDFNINLNEIQVVYPENHNNKIDIGDSSIILKEPSFGVIENIKSVEDGNITFEIIAKSIQTVVSEGTAYNASDFSDEDLLEFVQSLDIATFSKIQKFFDTLPRVEKVLNYTNELGHERKIILNSLNDFFTLG